MQTRHLLLVVRKASNISIRRYLVLADSLRRCYGLTPLLFGIDDCEPAEIARCREDLRRHYGRDCPLPPYVRLSEVASDRPRALPVPPRAHGEDPLLETFLAERYADAVRRVGGLYQDFEAFLQAYRPALVIYDIPILWTTHVLLDACRRKGAKVVSMEHAEGVGDIYAHFTDFADYYLAYGDMTLRNIRRMGVDEERILLTGNLDTDLLADVLRRATTPAADREKGILLLLKPVKVAGADRLNQYLIDAVCQNFPRHRVQVRVHPSVLSLADEQRAVGECAARHANAEFVDAGEPLAVSLERVGAAVSFPSYALIESVLMGRRTVCVTGIQGFVYDDWRRFGITCVDKDQMKQRLVPALLDQAVPDAEQVQALTAHFRYRNDGQALQRMLDSLGRVLGLEKITGPEALA